MTRIDKILKPLDDLAAQYRKPLSNSQSAPAGTAAWRIRCGLHPQYRTYACPSCKAYANAKTLALLLAHNATVRRAVAL